MNDLEIQTSLSDFWKSFGPSSVIASAPVTFFIAGEHAVLMGAPASCMNPNLRVYVGLACGAPRSAKLGVAEHRLVWATDRGGYVFQGVPQPEFLPVWKYITQIIEADLRDDGRSVDMRIVSQLPPAIGCNWSGAFSLALSAAIEALKTSRGRLAGLNGRRIVARAWRLESIFHGSESETGYRGWASGYGVHCPWIGPVSIYHLQETVEFGVADNLFPAFKYINSLRPCYSGSGRTIDWSRHLPFDIGLIDSGRMKFTGQRIRKLFEDGMYTHPNMVQLAALCSDVSSWIGKFAQRQPCSGDDLLRLIDMITSRHLDLGVVGNEFEEFYAISSFLQKTYGQRVSLKLTGAGGGGCLLYFCDAEVAPQVRTSVSEFCDSLHSSASARYPCRLVWNLKHDGVDHNGLKMERFRA